MSIITELAPLTGAQRKKKKKRKQLKRKQQRPFKQARPPPLSVLLDDQVLTIEEWAKLNRFSVRTGKNLIARGDGPRVIQLSARRIGIRVIDNRRWQEARARS